MKIALCLAGQYRTFDSDYVQKSLYEFILNKYDCDIYFSTWSNRGVSLMHNNPQFYKDNTEEITEQHILKYIPNAKIEIENYNEWKLSLSPSYNKLLNKLSNTLYRGNIPQLYKKFKSNVLINGNYDCVIITRPDLLYWDNLEIEECIKKTNTIWNINPHNPTSYYPNRIYDIFMMGTQSDIQKISHCYFNIEYLTDDPYRSGLLQFDCCKMLYIYAKKHCGLEVDSVSKVISEVYRGESLEKLITHYSTYCDLTKLKAIYGI